MTNVVSLHSNGLDSLGSIVIGPIGSSLAGYQITIPPNAPPSMHVHEFQEWARSYAPPYAVMNFPPGHPELKAPYVYRCKSFDLHIERHFVLEAVLMPADKVLKREDPTPL
jgi:hypothetical protein